MKAASKLSSGVPPHMQRCRTGIFCIVSSLMHFHTANEILIVNSSLETLFKMMFLSTGHCFGRLSANMQNQGICWSPEYVNTVYTVVWFTVRDQFCDLTRTSPIWTYGVSLGLETHAVAQCTPWAYTEHLHVDKDAHTRRGKNQS